jgi:hypothetical protein
LSDQIQKIPKYQAGILFLQLTPVNKRPLETQKEKDSALRTKDLAVALNSGRKFEAEFRDRHAGIQQV